MTGSGSRSRRRFIPETYVHTYSVSSRPATHYCTGGDPPAAAGATTTPPDGPARVSFAPPNRAKAEKPSLFGPPAFVDCGERGRAERSTDHSRHGHGSTSRDR